MHGVEQAAALGASLSVLFLLAAPAYAQLSEPTVLTDMTDNRLAQEILDKIEQSKKWIAELEALEYENLEAQQDLEEKRAVALQWIERDLAEWEELLEANSPRNAFERFAGNVQDEDVRGVFWDQFEFKEQKVKAGRAAFQAVIDGGGSRHEALAAYRSAAETKRIELVEANLQFNVGRGLAYYGQQAFFDRYGQIADSAAAREQTQLRYDDYRNNPAYVQANPKDRHVWEDYGSTSPKMQCRDGYVMIHRLQADDHVCVSVPTAEMWIRYGMGQVVGNSTYVHNGGVTPLTECGENLVVIYNLISESYSCVLSEMADLWVGQGIADLHGVGEYAKHNTEQYKDEINSQIQQIREDFENARHLVERGHFEGLERALAQSDWGEANAVNKYLAGPAMSKDELSRRIAEIRDQYESEKARLDLERDMEVQALEDEFGSRMAGLVLQYAQDPVLVIVESNSGYEAVLRGST